MSYSPRRAAPSHSKTETKPKRNQTTGKKSDVTTEERKKMKIMTIVILAVLGVVIVVSLFFIISAIKGNNGDGNVVLENTGMVEEGNSDSEVQSSTTNIAQYYENGVEPTSGDRHDITLAAENGGANASQISGTWVLDQDTSYIFDKKGRGVMLINNEPHTFTYSAQRGKLAIDMDADDAADYEYDYTFAGNTLTMSRDDNTLTLTKSDQ